MKLRLVILGSAICAAAFLTSCTREYTCRCTWSHSGAPGLPQGEVKEYPITDTKKGAESKCKNGSHRYEEQGIVTEENCVLF